MATDSKPKGPASYFPSIEMTYGQPMDYWLDIVEKHQAKKHMEIVGVLKSEHGMGHGQANAVVAFYLANKSKWI